MTTETTPPGGETDPVRIGPYHVIQVIGTGGMGTVYLCEQREPIRRTVAVKMMNPGLDTREVIGRFEAERQALAVMDHPNIARVLDAGATETGRPYFVMEHVKGIPFTDFCDRRRLTTLARLALFRGACLAVQHAHQKGIIHRDLKPSNILVTEADGTPLPKVIDFGIAKAINWRLSAQTFATEIGRPIGTPAYMSPEQWEASGLDVDTRTDVYSLGVVLYEVLVGRLPVDPVALLRAGPGAAVLLMHSTPATPSSRLREEGAVESLAALRATDARALRRELAGDLDWIVMKALEADRGRRYQTAQELADDIARHLRHDPVVARPPTAAYRIGRFMRRHRVGTSVAMLLVALGAVFTAFTAVQARRLAREKARAELAQERAAAFGGFLQAALLSPDPLDGLGRDATMLQVLDPAVARLNRQPESVAAVGDAVRSDIGWAYHKLGLYDRAEPLLRAALESRRANPGVDRADLAESLVRLGTLLSKRGENDSAAAYLLEALALRREPGDRGDARLAEALLLSGNFFVDRDTAASRAQLNEARELYRRASDSAGIAAVDAGLGTLEYWAGNFEAAHGHYQGSLSYVRRFGDHPKVAQALNNLGGVQEDLNLLAQAESSYRESLRIGERRLGPDHDIVTATVNNLALLLSRTGRREEATTLFRRALRTDERVLGPNATAVAIGAMNLSGVLCRGGDAAEGAAMGRRAVAIFTRDPGPDAWETAAARVTLARCLIQTGQGREAESLINRSLPILEQHLGADHWRVDSARVLLQRLRP